MKPLRTFRLEAYLGEWELSVRHHLTASDAQSMKLAELLAMGSPEEREQFLEMPLTYIDSWGTQDLREAIAGTYETLGAEHVLTFTGAEEALYWAMQEIVGPGDHAIVLVPCYQSMETVTVATGADVSPLVVRRETGWALDVEEVRSLVRPNTKLIAVNYPHNPTGHVPDATTFRALAGLCDERGLRLFCDEVYRGIEVDPSLTLPQAADLSEKAVSLNVASKSYGLPGLRVGWLACRDRAFLERMEKRKHYTSICNPGPTEHLAAIALRNRERIWARNRGIIAANRPLFADFFTRWEELFDYEPPVGGCVCFPRYRRGDAEELSRGLLLEKGVLVMPPSIYYSELADVPTDHFRVGLGRLGLDAALAAFDDYLTTAGGR